MKKGRCSSGIDKVLTEAGKKLGDRLERGASPLELAFYGGTFTGQPREDIEACLAFARHWRERGVISAVRCSTRPDRVDKPLLAMLKEQGVELVELGVQSFSDAALAKAKRGYTGKTAIEACAIVRDAGLLLGVQLMPGMPGVSPVIAGEDVKTAIGCKPACVRLYPCQVIKGTELAALWRTGGYAPWGLKETLDFLADALLEFWAADIPVIRMGLAPEEGLEASVLAGPRHPALGARARSLALARHIRAELALAGYGADRPFSGILMAPARSQGEFWGHRKEQVSFYAPLGITPQRVHWWDNGYFALMLGV